MPNIISSSFRNTQQKAEYSYLSSTCSCVTIMYATTVIYTTIQQWLRGWWGLQVSFGGNNHPGLPHVAEGNNLVLVNRGPFGIHPSLECVWWGDWEQGTGAGMFRQWIGLLLLITVGGCCLSGLVFRAYSCYCSFLVIFVMLEDAWFSCKIVLNLTWSCIQEECKSVPKDIVVVYFLKSDLGSLSVPAGYSL